MAISKSATFQTQPRTSMKSGTPRAQRSAETPFARMPATSSATPIQSPHCRPSPRSPASHARTNAPAIVTSEMRTRSGSSLGLLLKTSPLACEIAHSLLSRSATNAATNTGIATRATTEG